MQINIDTKDIANLGFTLKDYNEYVVSNINKSRKKHANMIERGAKKRVSVKSSRLITSIKTKHEENTSYVGTNVVYARAREYGSKAYIISPKKAKFLRFKGRDGNWVYAKRVFYPAGRGKKPYLIPAFEEVIPKFKNDIERILSDYVK